MVQHAAVISFYERTLRDQPFWSPELNLHFGFYRRGLSPFDRESLLDEMNAQVTERLGLRKGERARLLDAGCGTGATARHLARAHQGAHVLGLTLVPSQRDVGNHHAREQGLHSRVRIETGDFLETRLGAGSMDGAYAIESACYAPGSDKDPFFREMARVLRPGGRLVVADLFVRHVEGLSPLAQRLHDAMCKRWVLGCFGNIVLAQAAMERAGFWDIRVEDISLRVIPSVAHVPFAVARALWHDRDMWRCRSRRANLMAPLFGGLSGLQRTHFGYYFLSGRRGASGNPRHASDSEAPDQSPL